MNAVEHVSLMRYRRWLLVLFLIAGAVRVEWVTARWSGDHRSEALQYPDEEAYVRAGRSLAAGQGLVDEFGFRATYMPAYPAFIAGFQGLPEPLFWTRIVQALLSAWVAPATCLLARHWISCLRRRNDTKDDKTLVPILAGLIVAFDPFLMFFSGLLLTEALFAAALVSAWIFVLGMSTSKTLRMMGVVGAAFFLFIAVMLRPSAMVLVFITLLVLMLLRRFDRTSVLFGLTTLSLLFAGLFPWALRNHRTIGEWRWLTTRGGISLYDGVREGADGGSDLAHTKSLPDVAGLSETQWDRYFNDRAWSAIRENPSRILRLAANKFLRTWSLTPNVETYRRGSAAYISAAWMLFLLFSSAVGWWISRRNVREWVLLLLPVIVITLMHMVFVGSVRYRVPLMPMIAVLSATGIAKIISTQRRASPAAK